MPELPEVETVCKGLSNNILNFNITDVRILNNKLRYTIPSNLKEKILNTKVKVIIRRGKNGLLILNSEDIIVFHLGMTGKFKILNKCYLEKKHDHLVIEFNKNIKLVYNDVRKFGYILLYKKPFDIFKFRKMGCEPSLVTTFKEKLFSTIKRRDTTIKAILLDQTYICGIGNIYANEILFTAKILPYKRGVDISKKKFFRLLKTVQFIINLAITKGGSSIKNYVDINSDLGYFQTEFKVYNRNGMSCYDCGNLISKIRQNGRATYFCNKCQS